MFWSKKKTTWKQVRAAKPDGILVLAPMADVTDYAFREIISEIGMPNILYTEFVSADGLASKEGRPKLMIDFKYSSRQKPIIAQIFSGDPENCRQAAVLVQKLGFDGVDINMGCPKRTITKQLCGSELIKLENRERAENIIKAVRKGAPKLELAVKTRIGWNSLDVSWIEFLLNQKPDVLTIHLRTRQEMSKVPAHWELMTMFREMRDRISPETLILGNGDINSYQEAKDKIKEHGIDGVMIGRGIFKNPLLFANKDDKTMTVGERLSILEKHARLFEKEYGEGTSKHNTSTRQKSFHLMKKFTKVYVNEFKGAKELREHLMNTKDSKEFFEQLDIEKKKY